MDAAWPVPCRPDREWPGTPLRIIRRRILIAGHITTTDGAVWVTGDPAGICAKWPSERAAADAWRHLGGLLQDPWGLEEIAAQRLARLGLSA